MRAAKSSGSSIRMWSPLIDSAFFWSKRAGFGLTSAMSNAATISSSENTSRSWLSDQPSSDEVVEQALGDEPALALQEQVGSRVALGELLVAVAEHERHVAEARDERRDAGVDERPVQRELAGRRGHQVFAAQHVRDAHQRVIDRVDEV